MRKGLVIILAFTILPIVVISQDLDRKLEQTAMDLAKKLNKKETGKVAIWGFFAEDGKENALGTFLTEDFSIHLTNNANAFSIVERRQLKTILKEHRLSDEGYIDQKTAKQLGKFSAADAVLVGTYSVLRTEIKIRVKVLDTETALQVAGVSGNLPMTPNIARMLGRL